MSTQMEEVSFDSGRLLDYTPVIYLSDAEIADVYKLSDIRTDAHHDGDVDWNSEWDADCESTIVGGDGYDRYDGEGDLNIVGISGEYAFSKFYDLGRPYSEEGLYRDDGYDFKIRHIPSGETFTVDVKCTTRDSPSLMVPSYKEVKADLYVQTKLFRDENKVIIPGFASREQIKSVGVSYRGLKQPARVVSKYDLSTMWNPEDIEKVEDVR